MFTPEVEIAAFRVAQEAVTNVIRHAQARSAIVTIEQQNGRLEVSIEDDGRGFDIGARAARGATGMSVGLLGMEERVRVLGGDFTVDSRPGRGTRVHASIPTEAAS
jgi:signal transduction histidine kinase